MLNMTYTTTQNVTPPMGSLAAISIDGSVHFYADVVLNGSSKTFDDTVTAKDTVTFTLGAATLRAYFYNI